MQARLAGLICGGGLAWCAYITTNNFTSFANIHIPDGGPKEVIALGVVIWLHSKYRRMVEIR